MRDRLSSCQLTQILQDLAHSRRGGADCSAFPSSRPFTSYATMLGTFRTPPVRPSSHFPRDPPALLVQQVSDDGVLPSDRTLPACPSILLSLHALVSHQLSYGTAELPGVEAATSVGVENLPKASKRIAMPQRGGHAATGFNTVLAPQSGAESQEPWLRSAAHSRMNGD